MVSDNMGMVWRIDAKGTVERFVDATDFPRKITNFNDIEIDSAATSTSPTAATGREGAA